MPSLTSQGSKMGIFKQRSKSETLDVAPHTPEKKEWSSVEAWLFNTVTGVYHTDPANGDDALFDVFFIQLPDDKGIVVTPETAAVELEKLREAFEPTYPHIFEAAIPTKS